MSETFPMSDLLSHEKQKITTEIKEWSSELDTVLPISSYDIPGFISWVNCSGFQMDRENGHGHDGYDFGAYLREDGKIVIGLPNDTPIRVVADGRISSISDSGYSGGIHIEHGDDDSGMLSIYLHVIPSRKISRKSVVNKGEIIGTLYKDQGETSGRLVHLHLGLIDGWGTHGTSITGGGRNLRMQDPSIIDPSIIANTTTSQGFSLFDFNEISGAKGIELSHFNDVRINNTEWNRISINN